MLSDGDEKGEADWFVGFEGGCELCRGFPLVNYKALYLMNVLYIGSKTQRIPETILSYFHH